MKSDHSGSQKKPNCCVVFLTDWLPTGLCATVASNPTWCCHGDPQVLPISARTVNVLVVRDFKSHISI